jgi:5-methylcytosine-specific restriction enzyme A
MKIKTLRPKLKTVSMSPLRDISLLKAGPIERKRGRAGVKDRDYIRARDGGVCQECKRQGRVTPGRVVDHIEPLWAGGSDEASNKELLCDHCHDAKTAREAATRSAGGLP